ncbi:hypothetical protein KNP414_07090 [Paenibacillus mucilaginosus KNP414]|uniref:Uncharacterized protein n=1 Tax=Paenibacillus mucilaginosus (strain KNP414) TaxID=1036673 RepID=F8FKK7_PAEMK|nr:hypothetical protein KNP414_07090 [Paenibacillus mucilaginosus KNP414]
MSSPSSFIKVLSRKRTLSTMRELKESGLLFLGRKTSGEVEKIKIGAGGTR